MKSKSKGMMVLVVLLLFGVVCDALAFYNPSTGRWLSRDPVEEKGGLNVYGFTGNNSVERIDIDGLSIIPPIVIFPPFPPDPPIDIDTQAKSINVAEGSIIIIYGHQNKSNPWKFVFKNKCSAGAAVVCWPKLSNNDIPSENQIPGAPMHDDYMYFYNSLTSIANTAVWYRRHDRPPETDGDNVLVEMTSNAKAKAEEICNRCCRLKRVIIHFHRNAAPAGVLIDMSIPKAPPDIRVECVKKA